MHSFLFDYTLVNLYGALLSLIPALINIGIVFYISLFLPSSKTTNVFTFFVVALILWQLEDTMMRLVTSAQAAEFWDRILCIGWLGVAPLAFHFACLYTSKKSICNTRIGLLFTYLPFLIFEVFYQANSAPSSFHQAQYWGWINETRPGTLDEFQRYYISIMVIATLVILFAHAFRSRHNREIKIQSLLIAIGILIPTIQGITTQVVLPLFIGIVEIPVTSSFLTIFSFATIVALSKFKLFSVSESVSVDAVLENMTDFVFIISPSSKIMYANPHLSKIFHLDKNNRLPFYRFFNNGEKAFRHFEEVVIKQTLIGNDVKNFETEFITPENNILNVLVSSNVISNNKQVQGLMLVARDITERKRLTQILQAEKEVFEMASEGLELTNILDSFLSNIEQINRNNIICSVMIPDIKKETIKLKSAPSIKPQFHHFFDGMPISAESTPSGRAMFFQKKIKVHDFTQFPLTDQIRELITNNGIQSMQAFPIISSFGELIGGLTVYYKYKPDFQASDYTIDRAVNIIRIIIEKDESARKVMKQQQIYMELVNAIEGIVYEAEPENFIYTFVSSWAEKLLGYSVDKWINEPQFWINHIHKDDRMWVKEFCLKESRAKPDYQLEYRMISAEGEVVWLKDIVTVIVKDGIPEKLKGIMVDITAKKMAELEREKITTDIIRRNNDLEQFSYIVSHNLRAPLANIIGYTMLIDNNEIIKEEQGKLLSGLMVSVNRLEEVIKDLNHILQVKQELMEIKVNVFFNKLVNDIAHSISNVIEKEQVQFITDFTRAESIMTTSSYMYSIFYNLISNSIKYRLPDQNPVIEISSKKHKGMIILSFKDNGLGIDLNNQGKKVFGLYNRFHPNVSEGKGFGLFMVKTQVEALGGKINISSKINEGTQFTLEFYA